MIQTNGSTKRLKDADDSGAEKISRPRLPLRFRALSLLLGGVAIVFLVLSDFFIVGAIMRVGGHAPMDQLTPRIVSEDTLVPAIRRLANSRAWLMVIVVAVLSGIWPPLKIVITLALTGLTDAGALTRGSGLFWLQVVDTFGRWSFSDLYLIVINFCAFDIDTPEYQLSTFGSMQVHMFMELHTGVLLFAVALIISVLVSAWARLEVDRLPKSAEELAGQPLLRQSPKLDRPRLVASLGLLAAVLHVAGMVLPFLIIRRGGFLGNLIRDEERDLHLTLFGAVRMLGMDNGAKGIICTVLILVNFVIPLLELLGLSAAAAGLLGEAGGQKTIAAALFAASFNSVPVLVILTFISNLELPTAVAFNIGDQCDAFQMLMNNRQLLDMVGLGWASSTECFEANASIGPGVWLLILSVILRSYAWWHTGALAMPPPLVAATEAPGLPEAKEA